MLKKLLALSLALFLCASPVFAASDSSDYYKSYNPVASDSAWAFRDSSLNPVLATASTVVGWADTDRTLLKSIERALTTVAMIGSALLPSRMISLILLVKSIVKLFLALTVLSMSSPIEVFYY